MQADWHALQPMHFETSMSLATSVCLCAGGVTRDADRRITSCSPNFGGTGLVVGFGNGGNIDLASSRHRPCGGLDVDQERLEFRRLDIGVADERREHIG